MLFMCNVAENNGVLVIILRTSVCELGLNDLSYRYFNSFLSTLQRPPKLLQVIVLTREE